MCNVWSIDFYALTLQDAELKIQKFRRHTQTIGNPEKVVTLFERIHNISILQQKLGSKDISLVFHSIRVIKECKLMECA